MSDYSSRISAASGDAVALLTLAIELAQEVARLSATAAALEQADVARRSKQTERTRRHRNVTQRDITPQGVTERDVTAPPPPQVSSSFPTPHITPSFPPAPQQQQPRESLQPVPQGAEEQQVHDRAAEAWPTLTAFLEGKDAVARRAWMGRFIGALDRPPYPTGAELRDALGDLMTEPREKWTPALFRRYVERIRRDADRDAERAAAPASEPRRAANSPDDATAWDAALDVVGRAVRHQLSSDDFAELPAPIRAGLRAVGGWTVLRDAKPNDMPFRRKEFLAAYRAAASSSSRTREPASC